MKRKTTKSTIKPRCLKAGLAAQYVGLSVRGLADLAEAGQIPYIRAGTRTHLYDIADLDRFLDSHKIGVEVRS